MTEKFLKAKHWQLFLIIFGIPVLMQIVIMGKIVFYLISGKEPDPFFMFNYFPFLTLITILVIGVLLGWVWAVAIGLQHKVPEGITMKVKKFKVFFFAQLIYIIFFLGFFMTTFFAGPDPLIFAAIIPLHIFSMFCMFYTLYFVAKTFKTVELQREVHFSDFAGEFFMIWFYPIGVWIVQPKINKMIEKS